MHRSIIIYGIFLFLIIPASSGQQKGNFGLFAGTTYYLGDINPSRQFYRPAPSFGVFYRYSVNTRYAIRANFFYVHLSGSDLDFPGQLHPDRQFSPAVFKTSLADITLQVEYNFLAFTPNIGKWQYTPYICTGISGALVVNSDVGTTNFLSIPFGIGIKTNFTRKLGAGAEWSYRKTFTDNLDGVQNPSGIQSLIHNNDWYSILGIFITFKFFNFAGNCPAYE